MKAALRRAYSHFYSQNYTTNSGFICKRTKALPALTRTEPVFWKRSRVGRMAEAMHPTRAHLDARTNIKHPPHALAARAARAGCRDIERGERSRMIRQVVIFQEGRNQRTSALSVTPYP